MTSRPLRTERAHPRVASGAGALGADRSSIPLSAQTPPAPSETPAPKITCRRANDAYVSGPTLLRARVEPPEAAVGVTFFVDGRQVCALERAPFECEWDAGAAITEHQVRAVATLTAGGRLVQTVRTKSRRLLRARQRRRRPGHGHGQRRPRPVRPRHSAVGVPRLRRQPAAGDHPFRVRGRARSSSSSAIDIQGSMAPAMPKLKAAVKGFLGAVPAQHQVTLLGFNDNIFTLTRKATDPAERVKAVDRLAPWGSTALYDVLLRGVEMLGRQTGRKALVVFTDGEDQGSHATIRRRRAPAAVERRDAVHDRAGPRRHARVAQEGHGAARARRPAAARCSPTTSTSCTKRSPICSTSSRTSTCSATQSTNSKRDDAWRRIKVDVDGHGDVRARQGYRAAGSQMTPRTYEYDDRRRTRGTRRESSSLRSACSACHVVASRRGALR